MRFRCKKCKGTKDLYKVTFTTVGDNLVCKDAYCCDEYMEHEITEEYEGMPEIRRNDSAMDKGDKLWNDFKHNNTEK